jgi:hypothetical protein
MWKNEECRIDDTDLEIGDGEFVDSEDFYSEKYRYNSKFGFGSSHSYPFYGIEGHGQVGQFGCNNFHYRKGSNKKFLSSGNPLIEDGVVPRYGYTGLDKLRRERAKKKKDVYRPEDFALGDIVWAKCGKRYPWWPAVVIDPILKAPDAVLSCCVPGALCVMFYGYSKNGTQRVYFSCLFSRFSHRSFYCLVRLVHFKLMLNGNEQDYAWVKQGMIFPFAEFMDRYVDDHIQLVLL